MKALAIDQTVCGTWSTWDNCFGTIKNVVVSVAIQLFNIWSTRSSDNNFLSTTSVQSVFSSCFGSKETSCFKNDVYTVVSPVDLFWITFSETLTNLPLTSNPPSLTSNGTVETTWVVSYFNKCASITGSVRSLMRVTSSTFYVLDTTESKTTDTSETVNTNFNYH